MNSIPCHRRRNRRAPTIETKFRVEGNDDRFHPTASLYLDIIVDGVECQSSLIMSGPKDWVEAFMAGEFPLNEATEDYRFKRRPAYKPKRI